MQISRPSRHPTLIALMIKVCPSSASKLRPNEEPWALVANNEHDDLLCQLSVHKKNMKNATCTCFNMFQQSQRAETRTQAIHIREPRHSLYLHREFRIGPWRTKDLSTLSTLSSLV